MMKSLTIAVLALFSLPCFAQLPEYPDSQLVAELDPALTDLLLGDQFSWADQLAVPRRLVREETKNDVLTSCIITEMLNPNPLSTGIGPSAFLIDRFDTFMTSSTMIQFFIQPYGQEGEVEYEVFCLKVRVVNGEPDYNAGLAFTVGDFKRLFPKGSRRTGFFRLPRPRDA